MSLIFKTYNKILSHRISNRYCDNLAFSNLYWPFPISIELMSMTGLRSAIPLHASTISFTCIPCTCYIPSVARSNIRVGLHNSNCSRILHKVLLCRNFKKFGGPQHFFCFDQNHLKKLWSIILLKFINFAICNKFQIISQMLQDCAREWCHYFI